MQPVIHQLNNLQSPIEMICGGLQTVELKLRLLAESNQCFREGVYKLINHRGFDKSKNRSEYWNCPVGCLTDAIEPVFSNVITSEEKDEIKKFKGLRDKMLHGDLIGFYKELDVSLGGQYILSSSRRNQLHWDDPEVAIKEKFLKQAIMRLQWNGSVNKFRGLHSRLDKLLDKLLVEKT